MMIVYCRDWIIVQQRIREHQDFGRWFVEYPEVLRDKLSQYSLQLISLLRTPPGWKPTCLTATPLRTEFHSTYWTPQRRRPSTRICSTSSTRSRTDTSEWKFYLKIQNTNNNYNYFSPPDCLTGRAGLVLLCVVPKCKDSGNF